ncbi:hypothetical protein [Pseudanabaena sp. 'Roaring Creek']|uniref:hypothetical protein n=1 Tax=Pseudanabaena sp. 'Roaring Creek' TaxID=1681830 RepID=UPI0006D7A2CE|nr:hypothetical protein [Pseudanabaena sp. 'Roaring Creek']
MSGSCQIPDTHEAISRLFDFALDFQSSGEEIAKVRSHFRGALADAKDAIASRNQIDDEGDDAINDESDDLIDEEQQEDETTIESLRKELADTKAELARKSAIADEATEAFAQALKRFAIDFPVKDFTFPDTTPVAVPDPALVVTADPIAVPDPAPVLEPTPVAVPDPALVVTADPTDSADTSTTVDIHPALK